MIFRKLPPPTKLTITDKYKLMLTLGVVILWQTVAIAVSPPALMIGIAFIGFGVYRLWLGYTRLKQLRKKE